MACNAAKPHNHASMLYGAVAKVKPCPYNAHIRAHAESQQLLQAILIDYLCIIIQKQKVLPFCMAHAKIINGRIIEYALPLEHLDPAVFSRRLLIIGKGFLLLAVVLHNQHLIILIAAAGNGGKAFL